MEVFKKFHFKESSGKTHTHTNTHTHTKYREVGSQSPWADEHSSVGRDIANGEILA